MSATAFRSFDVTGAGMLAGPTMPKSWSGIRTGRPDSLRLGTFGKAGSRPSPVTASALMRPAWMSGSEVASDAIVYCTSPAIMAVSVSLPVLKGTCTALMPTAALNCSTAR